MTLANPPLLGRKMEFRCQDPNEDPKPGPDSHFGVLEQLVHPRWDSDIRCLSFDGWVVLLISVIPRPAMPEGSDPLDPAVDGFMCPRLVGVGC